MGRFACVLLLAATPCSFGLAALAADLAPRMEPVPPVAHIPAFSWTGFYLGGELGWIQTDAKYTTGALPLGAPFVVTSGSDKNGLTYGILAGYNYQVGQLVVGVEGDYAFTNNWFTGVEYRYSQYEAKSFVYPIPIPNLGFVGFKQELSNNQVTARIGYKF
jgi:outer membrane immunogenic protein